MPYLVAFSSNITDQQCLSKAGGCITFRKDKPVFKFENKAQYQKYLELKKEK